MFRRFLAALLLPILLAACGAEPVWAPDDVVQQAVYSPGGTPTITLFTVISTRTGEGAHSSLLINGSQRLIFDPAGTFKHPNMPERNDVIYGVTDPRLLAYVDYHTRVTYYTEMQEIVVSPEVAEAAIRAVQAYGAVPKAYCADSVSSILHGLPGFESIHETMFPKNLMAQFGKLPLSRAETFRDDDPDNNHDLLRHPRY
jgi:hypothetical protein